MHSSTRAGLSVVALTAAFSASAALTFSRSGLQETPGNKRPDLNAIVNRRIDTTESLVHQVKTDPEVSDRYERHFAMNRRELVAYLGSLHPTELRQSGTYTVYSVPDGGYVKMHRQTLKKGSPVFADRSGRPTLIVKCGNPLVLGPSKSRKSNLLTVLPPDEEGEREMAMLAPRDPEMADADSLLAMMPPLPEEAILPPAAPIAGTGSAMPLVASVPATATGGGFGIPLLAGLFVPFFGSLRDNGGGGAIAPVPEPATMAVMALGLVAAARRRRG